MMYRHIVYYLTEGWTEVTTEHEILPISCHSGCTFIRMGDPETGEFTLIPMTAVKFIHTVPVTDVMCDKCDSDATVGEV